ncbi:MAG: hypothetical protein IKH65_00925 [Clostridia bacterium]|nr:hypothetical protein [Clostridia bacterium]
MTNSLKRIFSVLLCLIMTFGVFSIAVSAEDKTDWYKIGGTVELGSYPQTRVTDATLIEQLDKIGKTWVSYGYYSGGTDIGTMVASDYMKFCDFYSGTVKYRAVTFSQYRPTSTDFQATADKSNQDENGYYVDKVYYFRYEPIKWRIIDIFTEDDGDRCATLISENILDAQAFTNEVHGNKETNYYLYYRDPTTNALKEAFANNYYYSSIRDWLQKNFYPTSSLNSDPKMLRQDNLENIDYSVNHSEYNSLPSNDYVTLLSYKDALNTVHGFISDPNRGDDAKATTGTDYAKCQGLEINHADYEGNSFWRLRSAGDYSFTACNIRSNGSTDFNSDVRHTDAGIRPVIKYNFDYTPEPDPSPISNATLSINDGRTVNYGHRVKVVASASHLETFFHVEIIDETGKIVARGASGASSVEFVTSHLTQGARYKARVATSRGIVAVDAEGHQIQTDYCVISIKNNFWTRLVYRFWMFMEKYLKINWPGDPVVI